MDNFLIFVQIFYKIFKRLWLVHLCWMFPHEPKFWRGHCSTGLERNSCMKFFSDVPPRTKILAPPLYTLYTVNIIIRAYCIFICCHVCPPPNFYTWRTPCLLILLSSQCAPRLWACGERQHPLSLTVILSLKHAI